ncbi:hypothetical protein BO70DRAFT_290316 [Aspergillus heteromorphus CBS 117.55]|uniref:Rhodopsin domain-containing protein n=1 Tax=Aspergillus heteromorphus CBS 117.55 TaxID=1448321 RepID=A0A317WED5_9EURO|nr:uncharacterized protein BO70DRAFT_290316 [Aspergillus heteromorphus CBS 117.55]PWY84743.1 hypothetical protein BO70DRAFT_290316 [Aspergillus heteromorphus CBS 117.55]
MANNRLIESWTWFAVSSVVVFWRYASRCMLLGGFRGLMLEDYVMFLTYAFYTNFIVWVNIQAQYPETNILPPTGMQGLTALDIHDRVYGSTITFVLEQSMIVVQWGCKTCMILVYYRLTLGTRMSKYVKILMGYIALGFVVVEIFYYGVWCRPFADYFAVKEDNNVQCETAQHHLIMSYVFNVSSDVLMLCIPLPVILHLQLLWKKKLALCAVFSLGIFVVIAATLSRYYCFAHPDSILWIFWYVREASTAVIVANVPNCFTLVRRLVQLRGVTLFGTYVSLCRRSSPGLDSAPVAVRPSGERNGLQIWQHTQLAMEEERIEGPMAPGGFGVYGLQTGGIATVATGPGEPSKE